MFFFQKVLLVVAFALFLFAFSSLVAYVIQLSSSVMFNISVLATNAYALVLAVWIFHTKVSSFVRIVYVCACGCGCVCVRACSCSSVDFSHEGEFVVFVCAFVHVSSVCVFALDFVKIICNTFFLFFAPAFNILFPRVCSLDEWHDALQYLSSNTRSKQ